MKRTATPLLVVLLALAACAAPGGSPPPSDEGPPASGDPSHGSGGGGRIEHPEGSEPILVVESVGGFVPVDFVATQVPHFVLLGDGRVIMTGPQTLEFPGPALPPLIERTLTEAGIQEVLSAIEETGLFAADLRLDGAQNFVADAAETRFHLQAGGREVTVSVYGLGTLLPDMEAPGVSDAEIRAHEVLTRLHDSLTMIDDTISGEGWEAEGWQPYEPEALRLYLRAVTGEPPPGDGLPEEVRDWPTDDDPAAVGQPEPFLGEGARCLAVEGETAQVWFEELSAATQITRWTDDGERRFSVSARPLLPYEEADCPGLGV